jgi:serine/threonine protein kinase
MIPIMGQEDRRSSSGDPYLDRCSVDHPVTLGDYELLGKIGRGGMANVYRARRIGEQDASFAVKCMRAKLASETRFVEMFSREAKLALMLEHSSIVKTVDSCVVDGRHFIVMEYIRGQDLNVVLKRSQAVDRRLPIPHALYIAQCIAGALDYAHRLRNPQGRPLNIVNRDISPSNVRISYKGAVKLFDFGIAQAAVQVSSEIGVLKGKFAYMSPEQIRGLPVDARSDIFSLGTVLHEMLTGERLFKEESEFALMESVRQGTINPPSTFQSRVPEKVDNVVMRMLERDPSRRFQNARGVGQALAPLLDDYQFAPTELGTFVRELFPPRARSASPDPQPPSVISGTFPMSDLRSISLAMARHRKSAPKQKRPDPSSSKSSNAALLAIAALLFLATVAIVLVLALL